MPIARCLLPLCFGCLILFLSCSPELQAQSQTKDIASLIQCSIETETGTWSRENPLSVAVKIKNISTGPVDLVGIYSFQLISADGAPMTYWSPVNILDGTALKLDAGKVPEGTIHLEPQETKPIDLDVAKLLWNRSLSSVWPNQKLFEVVPRGNYDLIFEIEDRRKNSDHIPIGTHMASNKVRIALR